MVIQGALVYTGPSTAEMMNARADAAMATGPAMSLVPLSRYLDQPCLIIRGTRVNRRELIKYVANKMGGVHFDHRRDAAGDRAASALDGLVGTVRLAEKDVVYYELLAIGQGLVTSPQVVPLLVTT